MSSFLYSSDARTELLRSLMHSLATALLPRMNIIATYVYHNVIINVQQRLDDENIMQTRPPGIAAYYC